MPYVTYTNTIPYTEIASTPEWNAGARSIASFSGDGGFSFTVGQDTGIVAGLNTQDLSANYLEIQHGFYITNGHYRIVELGVTKTSLVSYATGAVFKITRVLGVVRYYVNDVLIYTSVTLSTGDVFLDSSLYSYQDSIGNLTLLEAFDARINIQLSPIDALGIQGIPHNEGIAVELLPIAALGIESTFSDYFGTALLSPLSVIADADERPDNDGLYFCAAELSPLTTTIVVTDVNRVAASLSPLQAIASVGQHQFIRCALEPLTAFGSADALLVPEYNAINAELRPLQVYGLRYDPDSATLDVEMSALEALGADFDVNLIQGEFLPLQASPILGLSDLLYATWPSFTVTILAPQKYIRSVFTTRYQQRREKLFVTTYSLGIELSSFFETKYALLDYDTFQSVFEVRYHDVVQSINEISYSDRPTLNHLFTIPYEDTLSPKALFTSTYSDQSTLQSLWSLEYKDKASTQQTFYLGYTDTLSLSVIQNIGYSDTESLSVIHNISYTDTLSLSVIQNIGYTDTESLSVIQSIGYADTASHTILYELSYSDTLSLSVIQNIGYADTTAFNSLNEVSYADTALIRSVTNQDYTDAPEFKSITTIGYADRLLLTAQLTLGYEGVDLSPIFVFSYGLLDACSSIFTLGYRNEAENVRSLFNLHYSLNDEDTHILTGSCWIEKDGRRIEVNEVSINADEGSSYYQCSATIINEADYRKFVVDSEFTVHLFSDEYRFLVDSKNLSRSMDDDGHLSLQMTIEGLSPVVRYAAPRALTLTKTWDEPTRLSDFIEELIGHVDYQAVDDYLPAYRLSAENAVPLDLAKATMESMGALIESLPDGSLKVRPLWPTSIVQLNTSLADHALNNDQLFSMSETPENNDWRNRFRIIDVDSSVQDTLEFIKDEENDLSGTLYAYPSPWRDGLTLRHTRGTPIYLGPLSEELVEMTLNSDNEIEAELVEFQEGESSTRYPIETILSFTWLAEDLGSVAFVPHTKTLKSSAGDGYSLAQIRYTSRRLKARTSSSLYTSAQYLLEES